MFTTQNCKKAFEATGLVPFDPLRVLNRLEVRPQTPPAPPEPETPWQSKTPSNTHEFGSQSKLISDSFTRSPVTTPSSFAQLIKGAEQMLHSNVLKDARIHELEEQLKEMTKRKSRKRKRIQKGGTLEYSEGAALVPDGSPSKPQSKKKARRSDSAERAQPNVRHYGNCGEPGHYAKTCKKVTD